MVRDGVLVIGSANMDLVVFVEKFPQPGETIFGKKIEMFPGGKGANQAVCCAKLGAKTFFVGKMGNDDFRKRLTSNMENEGVIIDHLFIDENESTGTALITVDGKGENEIVVISGSNMKLSQEDIKSKKEIFKNVKVVITQLEIPTEAVLETAKAANENGNIFILNPAPAQELPEKLLSMVDYLTPNETELELLSGLCVKDLKSIELASEVLLKKGVKNVIVTLGEKGAYLINKKRKEIFPANKVNVIDSTGAGDAFNGALAFALSKGEEPGKAIKFANSVASYSVTKMGAQSSIPVPDELTAK
ncbi:MAG: ribokinase [Ignavibacteria bacterium RBG_16_34_14]|nr:MAG: ribokinase [Ignavibacteria bacterium RBG_16_34_14]